MANEPMIVNTLDKKIEFLFRFTSDGDKAIIRDDHLQKLKDLLIKRDFFHTDKLRVGTIGEFKSGKSTLINALAGQDVAPTDLFEMTSWIAFIFSSDQNGAVIHRKDGSKEAVSLSSLQESCANRSISSEELKKIDHIDIMRNDINQNLVFIDTPGMGSTRRENETKMIEAIGDCDIILWTIDCQSLGNIDEFNLIQQLLKSQTPLLIVITKCDEIEEVEDHKEELKDYIIDNFHVSSDRIFFSHKKDNGELVSQDHLLSELTIKYSEQTKSIRERAVAAHHKRIESEVDRILIELRDYLQSIQKKVAIFDQRIDSVEATVFLEIQDTILKHTKETLFSPNGQFVSAIKEELKNNTLSEDRFKEIIASTISGSNMDQFLSKTIELAAAKISTEWSTKLGNIHAEFMQILFDFEKEVLTDIKSFHHSLKNSTFGQNLDESGEGLALTAGATIATTAYAALIGPFAAQLTLGAAFSLVGMPVAIVGGIASILYIYFKKGSAAKQLENHADQILNDYKKHFIDEIVTRKIFPEIRNQNHSIANELKKEFRKTMNIKFSTDMINDYIAQIDLLIRK